MNVFGVLWIASQVGNPSTIPDLPTSVNSISNSRLLGVAVSQIATPVSHDAQPSASSTLQTKALPQDEDDSLPPGDVMLLSTSLSRWTIGLRSVIQEGLLSIRVSQDDLSHAPSQEAAVCPQSKLWTQASGLPGEEGNFQVWVEDQLVARVPTQAIADSLADQLETSFDQVEFEFDPLTLHPAVTDDHVGIRLGEQEIASVDAISLNPLGLPPELIAIAWVNNLRAVFDADPLPVAEAQAEAHSLDETGQELGGTASWYGPYFHGRRTASGERFNQNELTAAHRSLPFNTYLKVTNLENDRSVIVRINDRGPYVGNRSLDLSRRAAICLGSESSGVVPYKAVIMKAVPTDIDAAAAAPESSNSGAIALRLQ